MKKKIAILTAGGDCPGLNAVIRAVAKKAINKWGADIIGIEDGFQGLVDKRWGKLEYNQVSGILTLGGTILGTSNVANPYKYPIKKGKKTVFKDLSGKVINNIKALGVNALVCVGGDGTMSIAYRLYKKGIPVVGIPKTIDNDIKGTEITFGFDSAVYTATQGIDKLHTTAQSHHRVMIIEVMGRSAGWIALYAGIAGGGDIILLPEIPYDIKSITKQVISRNKKGKRFSIVVIAEGARPKYGKVTVKRIVNDASIPARLGGVGFVLGEQIERLTGIESRTVVLGHLQRGGSPTPFDRLLGTQLGSEAVDFVIKKKFGFMVGVHNDKFIPVPLAAVAKGARCVPSNHPLIKTARSLGTGFGDN